MRSYPTTSSPEINQGYFDLYKEADSKFPQSYKYQWRHPWVCDECISSGIGEIADFEVSFVTFSKISFYFDYITICDTCRETFNYSKAERRWANEIFVIHFYSYPFDCEECHLKKRERNRIAHLTRLINTVPNPLPYLEIVTELMLKVNDHRALEYLRRAKNEAATLEQRREFEEKIALVKRTKTSSRPR